jgi:cytochrome b561
MSDQIRTRPGRTLEFVVGERLDRRITPVHYDGVMQCTHWATLILLITTLGTVWLTRNVETREQAHRLIELHRSLGLTVFCVTVFRLSWRRNSRVPTLPQYLPRFQKLAARTTEYLLYLLLLIQPILGFLHSNAHSEPISVFFLGPWFARFVTRRHLVEPPLEFSAP